MGLTRRGVFRVVNGALALLALSPSFAEKAAAQAMGDPQPFPDDYVVSLARTMAGKEFVPLSSDMDPLLADLTYDAYRSIRFDTGRSIWKGDPGNFSLDLLHTGFVFRQPIDIYLVTGSEQRRVAYDPTLFDFSGIKANPDPARKGAGYSGFRVRYPLNQPDVADEFAVFQGASYFRAVGKGQHYGLSARGLAIDTAQPKGEEFPFFRAFWVRKPEAGGSALVIDALLDSKSATGAYRFTLRPGQTTQIDVELTLFPRVDIAHIGFAPLTSMFLFDATNRNRFDDYRDSVHDSDGLAMLTGRGEWLWRPLANPKTLQISAFVDQGPRGFGLMQRKRTYQDYLDLEARYEMRPSLWVEPVGDWGAGHVELVEIPSGSEVNDNVVVYWRPRDPIAKGTEVRQTYRLHWTDRWPPPGTPQPAQTRSSAVGLSHHTDGDNRLFVLDFAGGNLSGDIAAEVSTGQGRILNAVTQPNPEIGGIRVHFELDPQGGDMAELRVRLIRGTEPVSETWLYRWTA
ncbi:MAG: glucan biosynthesis protein G [Hyphomicrobiales bacterium]